MNKNYLINNKYYTWIENNEDCNHCALLGICTLDTFPCWILLGSDLFDDNGVFHEVRLLELINIID